MVRRSLEVALEQDTVRLSQMQMSQLFDTSPLTFFQNIFRKEELSEEATAKESLGAVDVSHR
ncbi:MAG: hypothetical protein CME36_19985 [unclassified Hahellaceae]|nr:hypothetical protein [Hahellaceae bacterium]|tara:strand:- start:17 stop:202 length:186 start_codon:yes stop_codon:yes gene_type:complete